MTKAMELAFKLKALADQGVDGERENAEQMLLRHCAKHNINIEDLEKEEQKTFYMHCTPGDYKLLLQIASTVLGIEFNIGWLKGKSMADKNTRWIRCTRSEYVLISAKFDFYKKAYEEELEIFKAAFIQKNKLYPINDTRESTPYEELSAEEKEKMYRAEMLAEGIKKVNFAKQLTNDTTKVGS